MFAGKCSPDPWVEDFFDINKRECRDCGNFDDQTMTCQVVEGLEPALQCPELREFIRYEGIRLYGKLRRQMERITGKGVRQHCR